MTSGFFYLKPENICDDEAYFPEDESRHITKVFRHRVGDIIKAFDGQGKEFTLKLEGKREKGIICRILTSKDYCEQKFADISIGIGLLKGNKMDYVIQRLTELGISEIFPVITNRTVRNISAQKEKLRQARWQKITIESSKQCLRHNIPVVREVTGFSDFISNSTDFDLKIILWEEENKVFLKDILKKNVATDKIRVLLFIGPEGGFTLEEVKLAADSGFTSVSLGRRIIRAEGAAIVAMSILQYELGDLGRTDRDRDGG